MAKIVKVFEKIVTRTEGFHREDGGLALITEFSDPNELEDKEIFIRLHSWDPSKFHSEFKELFNKRVRITVEIVDDN